MILLRSLLFNVCFFGLTFVLALWGVGIRLFAPHRALGLAQLWARLVLAAARRICGIRLVLEGAEHLPREGPAIIASQHQSAFDTMVWLTLLPRPSYVLKVELTRIPLFGPLMVPSGMIPLDRGAGAAAIRALLRDTASKLAAGRQVVIFPEGTRVAYGAAHGLQPGIAAIAARSGLPVVPVALDSGRRWGRRAFLKRPGPIHLLVLPPLPAGLPRETLMTALDAALRAGAARLGPAVENSGESALPRFSDCQN